MMPDWVSPKKKIIFRSDLMKIPRVCVEGGVSEDSAVRVPQVLDVRLKVAREERRVLEDGS